MSSAALDSGSLDYGGDPIYNTSDLTDYNGDINHSDYGGDPFITLVIFLIIMVTSLVIVIMVVIRFITPVIFLTIMVTSSVVMIT